MRASAAISRIGPGRGEQRHVVVGLGLGDRKADRHDVEERRPARRHALRGKIGADVEGDLVAADAQRPPGDKRRVGASIGVGDRLLQQPFGARTQLLEHDLDAGGRPAGDGVEHVGGEPPVGLGLAGALHGVDQPQPRDVADLLQSSGALGLGALASRRWKLARIESRV